jgi:hypothetical protein
MPIGMSRHWRFGEQNRAGKPGGRFGCILKGRGLFLQRCKLDGPGLRRRNGPDRRFRASLARMIDFGVRLGRLSPVSRHAHRNQAGLRRALTKGLLPFGFQQSRNRDGA